MYFETTFLPLFISSPNPQFDNRSDFGQTWGECSFDILGKVELTLSCELT